MIRIIGIYKISVPNLPKDADHDYLMYETPILYSIHFFCEYVMNIITTLAVEFSKRMCNVELDFNMLKRDKDALNEFIFPVLKRMLKNITLWSSTMESAREWYNFKVQETFDTLSSDIDAFEKIGSNKRELDDFMKNKYPQIRDFIIQHCAPHVRAPAPVPHIQIPQVPSAPQSPVELISPASSQESVVAATFNIPEGLPLSPPPDASGGMISLTPLSQSPVGSPRSESIASVMGRAPTGRSGGGIGRGSSGAPRHFPPQFGR